MAEEDFHEALPLIPPSVAKDDNSPSETSASEKSSNANQGSSKAHYSLFVAICFSLNYSIGSGILGLPYDYFNAGYVLGSLLLLFLGFLTYITYTYVMDGMQRAEAITNLSKVHNISRHELLTKPENTIHILSNTPAQTLKSNYSFIENEYQLSELIGMFGGKWWKLFYDISYCISTLIALWSYSALFGVSLARNIGISAISNECDMSVDGHTDSGCRALYSLYVCIFWVWTLVVSLMDFTEQQSIQIFATFCRILIIGLMVFTSIGLIYSVWDYNGTSYEYAAVTTGENANGVEAWKWGGLAYMIAVSSFAYGNQYCVTDIIQPLSIYDRTNNQHKLWMYSVAICMVVYILIGVTVSLFFGNNTESPCTLAWRGFMGFKYTESEPIWALIVSWFIVLFPAIDIGSAFPLNAVTLANTIEAALMPQSENDENRNENVRICSYQNRYNILFRCLICTLTAILALIEWNFDFILAVSGAFGLLAVYVGPCVLEWKSREMMQAITNYTDVTAHCTQTTKAWTSHRAWIAIIVGTVVIAFIAIFVDTIQQYS